MGFITLAITHIAAFAAGAIVMKKKGAEVEAEIKSKIDGVKDEVKAKIKGAEEEVEKLAEDAKSKLK
jgi:hypothetical protein